MNMAPKLLVVDDDASWIQRLEMGVIARQHAISDMQIAMRHIRTAKHYDAAIIDLIMISRRKKGGAKIRMDAGCEMAVAFLCRFPSSRIAICSGADQLMPDLRKRNEDIPNVRFFSKTSTNIMTEISAFVCSDLKPQKASDDILRRLWKRLKTNEDVQRVWDSLKLEPEVFGVGLDLKELIDKYRRL